MTFVHSFIHPAIHFLMLSFGLLLFYLQSYFFLLSNSFTHPFTYIHSFSHSFIHSDLFIRFISSFIHPTIYTIIYSRPYLYVNSFRDNTVLQIYAVSNWHSVYSQSFTIMLSLLTGCIIVIIRQMCSTSITLNCPVGVCQCFLLVIICRLYNHPGSIITKSIVYII